MNNKKTYWMNVVLAVLFLCVTLFWCYNGSALQIITAEETYTTLMGFTFIYAMLIAPLVSAISAYSIIKPKNASLASVLNILQLLFVIVVALYAYSMPMSMIKKMMRPEAIIFFFFYALPSFINIRTLRKIEHK